MYSADNNTNTHTQNTLYTNVTAPQAMKVQTTLLAAVLVLADVCAGNHCPKQTKNGLSERKTQKMKKLLRLV